MTADAAGVINNLGPIHSLGLWLLLHQYASWIGDVAETISEVRGQRSEAKETIANCRLPIADFVSREIGFFG
jgi:hypothetical protein